MTAGVAADRRYTNKRRCPICDGAAGDPRGQEKRCTGFLSEHGDYAHCSREEHAGDIKVSPSETYGHRLRGPCACGTMHGEAEQARETFEQRIEATYDYFDESGTKLFQVVRLARPKEFRQRLPDGSWKLGSVRRVLYRLDEVLEASADRTIYVVEGEKDVDNMRRLGLVATTNPMGQGKWSHVAECASRALAGRHVVVIADADDVGRAHAAAVATSLQGVAASARVVECPGGAKDASDWIAAGARAEQFEALDARATAPAPKWASCVSDVDTILERSTEPLVKLYLGGDELAELRGGWIVELIGGTGRGKTSLALTLAVEHAVNGGPAIVMSLELPADELSGRIIGLRRDAGWLEVLRGGVERKHMVSALPPRLYRIERQHGSVETLRAAIADIQAKHSGEAVLVVVDYIQIMPSDEREIRARVGEAMKALDDVARTSRVVVLALAQGSRVSARELTSGVKLGAETTDTGAESAALEQWSSLTIAIGAPGEPAADGTRPTDLSIGKSRFSPGDSVYPARFNGRTGLWRLAGEARAAAKVRAERETERDRAKVDAAKLAIEAFATKAREPATRSDMRTAAHVKGVVADIAINELLADGVLVEVRRKKARAKDWQLWTPANASAHGVAIVQSAEDAIAAANEAMRDAEVAL